MPALRHPLHFHRPLSPLALSQRRVKAAGRLNMWLIGITVVAMAIAAVLAIALLFQATPAH